MTLALRHLLGFQHLPKRTISFLLNLAKQFKKSKNPPNSLQGKTGVQLFFEPSTRTRISFETAIRNLGGNVINFSSAQSSAIKGETLIDTAKTLTAIKGDYFIVRHPNSGAPHLLSQFLDRPIINAGDGTHEHPTQALLDLMTIEELTGKIEGLNVLIVGDIAHSRVARSNIYGLLAMGAKPTVCGPAPLIPKYIESLGATVSHDLATSLPSADVVMMLRIQSERWQHFHTIPLKEYTHYYSLTLSLMQKAKPDVIIMHPGPLNRGIEIDPEVADHARSVILNQVTNGIFARMAVLHAIGGAV